jgi:thiamine pyrophosphate-dependent acetolactate synthase large subunit-like protein
VASVLGIKESGDLTADQITIYEILKRIEQNRINHVLTTHAADGYARVSGKTGVVIATNGPGA